MVTGIDLSEKNGSIEWSRIGKGDIYFAFIKASEALDTVDSQFNNNLKAAQRSGILTGAYHWLHPGLHVGQQLDTFMKTVKDFRGQLPPVVCLQTTMPSLDEMEKNIKAFLTLLERRVGVKPIIFTSDTFWKTYLPQSSWGCDYPLWIDNPGTFWPAQLWPWAGWSFWQNSYQIRLPGIPLNLGSNWFNGTLDELRSMVIQ